jgi:lipopolysaccharide transport system ATP-binding protein
VISTAQDIDTSSRADSTVPASDAVVIAAANLGKAYRLFDQSQDRLKDQLLWRFGRRYGRDMWALRDVSFEVTRGEVFGIIGRNGSGKSTLLQLLVGVLQPTTGYLKTSGRIAALLELGSGFDPELTGRDNVYLSGSVLGLSTSAIDQLFPTILEFSELGSFIEQPVKYYSSGMFVRLAFALSTSVDADILVVDEALAVGDIFFQQKCYRRLESLREQGVTIVLVSHAMADVEQFCDRVLVLDGGVAAFVGEAREAVQRYYVLSHGHPALSETVAASAAENHQVEASLGATHTAQWVGHASPQADAWLDISENPQVSNGGARCLGVALCDETGEARRVFEQGQTAVFLSEFEVLAPMEVPICGIVLHNARGIIVHGKSTLEYGTPVPQGLEPGDRIRFRQTIALEVGLGEYTFEVGISDIPRVAYAERASLPHELLAADIVRVCDLPGLGPFVVTYRSRGQPVQLLHHGTANLPGTCETTLQRHDVADRSTGVSSGEQYALT